MALRIFQLQIQNPGSNVAPVPEIAVANQPLDRRTTKAALTPSVVVALTPGQLVSWDPDVVSWSVERSDDGGMSWAVVATQISDSPFYVDRPGTGTFRYRASTRTGQGNVSSTGNEVEVFVGSFGSYEDGAINEVDASTGAILERVGRSLPFADGLGEACLGTGACEGSLAGSYGSGSWYVDPREQIAPTRLNELPACGDTSVTHPLTSITYTIRDLPFPGGSGINDSSIRIRLSTTSQNSGADRVVWDGATDPWAPDVTVGIVLGGDPVLERDVTLTLDSAYVAPGDVVTVTTYVEDVDGNAATLVCSFTMESLDVTAPTVTNQDPECDLGTTDTDQRRAARNTPYSFDVYDNESGVDLATLQVFVGPSDTGPWTQVLLNGSGFLLGYFGTVSPLNGVNAGYAVTINRPVASPLWDPDALVCFRVTVDDLQGNSTEDICCWRTEAAVSIRDVIVLSERIIFVEFSGPLRRGASPNRVTTNYAITNDVTGREVRVLAVEPQKFFVEEQVVSDNPTLVEGDGDPRFMLLRTVPHTHWDRHTLTVSNLVDRYGLPMDPSGETGSYVARKTKFDSGSDGVELLGAGLGDNLTRNMVIAMMFGQEQIGGVFVSDQWEKDS